MEKTKEEIIKTLEEDLTIFEGQVDYYKHNKRKLIIPKHQTQFTASVTMVAYLRERLKLFKGE